MRDKILQDMVLFMKTSQKEKLAVIRMIKGAIQLEELKTKKPLTDDEVLTILNREVKSRNESIREFEKGNRQDLIDKTASELEIIKEYLPVQLTEEEVITELNKALETIDLEKANIGQLMGLVTPLFKGRTDLGIVSRLVKEKLQK